MTWTDSHCHLQLDERGGEDDLVRRAEAAGVTCMVCVGTDLETSHRALDLASRHHRVHATVGLHPHDASKLPVEWGQIEMLTAAEGVVAVGEAGFDLYYEHSPRDEQDAAFRMQIRLAKDRGLALVVHSRDAWDETFRVLAEEGSPPRTVFHCFTGGVAEARRALDAGASLSFSGIVTFANAGDVREAAGFAPADRILVETDSPFLTPVPHRGKTNEPAFVPLVGAAVAAARGCTVEEIAETTARNAAVVFDLTRD
jgi:TatD DNase family protein